MPSKFLVLELPEDFDFTNESTPYGGFWQFVSPVGWSGWIEGQAVLSWKWQTPEPPPPPPTEPPPPVYRWEEHVYKVTATAPLNVRVDPSTTAGILGKIEPGKTVRAKVRTPAIIGGNYEWAQIAETPYPGAYIAIHGVDATGAPVAPILAKPMEIGG